MRAESFIAYLKIKIIQVIWLLLYTMKQKTFWDHFKNYNNIFQVWGRDTEDSEINKSTTMSRIGLFSGLLYTSLLA